MAIQAEVLTVLQVQLAVLIIVDSMTVHTAQAGLAVRVVCGHGGLMRRQVTETADFELFISRDGIKRRDIINRRVFDMVGGAGVTTGT